MDWSRLVIGGRVRLRLPAGDGRDVEVTGKRLGRDATKFVDMGGIGASPTSNEFRAVVRLDDGTIVLSELPSIVGRGSREGRPGLGPSKMGAAGFEPATSRV